MYVRARVGKYVTNGVGSAVGRMHKWPASAAEVAAVTGFTPTHLWGCQNTSGNITDAISGGTLSPYGSVAAAQYAAPTPLANRKAFLIDDANDGRLAGATTGVLDPGTGSVALIGICRFTAYPGAVKYMCLRYGSSTGWLVQRDSLGFYLYVDDGAGGGTGVNVFFRGAMPEPGYGAFGVGYDVVAGYAWIGVASGNSATISRGDISGLSIGAVSATPIVGYTSNWDHDYLWLAGFVGAGAQMYGYEADVLNSLWRG